MAKKKVQIQGAQILRDDLYFLYHEETKDAAQHRIWAFYEAIKKGES
jgi:hypothetical protein